MIVVIFLAVLGGSLTTYAYAAGKARKFFNSRKKARALNIGAGTILIGAGVAVTAKNLIFLKTAVADRNAPRIPHFTHF